MIPKAKEGQLVSQGWMGISSMLCYFAPGESMQGSQHQHGLYWKHLIFLAVYSSSFLLNPEKVSRSCTCDIKTYFPRVKWGQC